MINRSDWRADEWKAFRNLQHVPWRAGAIYPGNHRGLRLVRHHSQPGNIEKINVTDSAHNRRAHCGRKWCHCESLIPGATAMAIPIICNSFAIPNFASFWPSQSRQLCHSRRSCHLPPLRQHHAGMKIVLPGEKKGRLRRRPEAFRRPKMSDHTRRNDHPAPW